MQISEIKEILKNTDMAHIRKTMEEFARDERSGVQRLLQQYERKAEKYEAELARIEAMRVYENKYPDAEYICGIDEVGRGPLAGPVVTCAVVLPKDCRILYVNDSKKLSEKKREELFDEIMEKAISVSVALESPQVIDDINILQATYQAMKKSIEGLTVCPDIVLADAVTIPGITPLQEAIIKGDAKSISIAAASIVAKVTRDRMMIEYDKLYPQYDFASNKGYGTEKHIQALKKFGATAIHRQSFLRNLQITDETVESFR